MTGWSKKQGLQSLFLMIAPLTAVAASPERIEHVYTESAEQVLAYWTVEKLTAVPDKGDVPHKPPVPDPLASDGDAWKGTGPFPAGVGRLMMRRHGGQDASCTATVLDSPDGNVLTTAFHCLAVPAQDNQPEWSTHLLFIPAFSDGNAPHGKFPVRRMVAPAAALAGNSDTAFLEVDPTPAGIPVAAAAGSQAIRFDALDWAGPRITFGYPVSANGYGMLPPPPPFDYGNPEYSGQRLAYCATQRPLLNGCKPHGGEEILEWGLPCVQGPGASGGPAMIDFDFDTGRGTVVGVNNMGVIVEERSNLCASAMNEGSWDAYHYISSQAAPR